MTTRRATSELLSEAVGLLRHLHPVLVELHDRFETLPSRERMILLRRHGIPEELSYEETLQQIGESLGITRERVRQLEARALRHLYALDPSQRLYPILEPERPLDHLRSS